MISLSLGRWRPRAWARGTSTARLSAARKRRSKSVRCPSKLARRARKSPSARAARMAAVWRAYTSHVVARNATSQRATQWRPLTIGRHLERPELGLAGPWVVRQLRRRGAERLLRHHPAQRPPAAGTHPLPRPPTPPPPPAPETLPHHR